MAESKTKDPIVSMQCVTESPISDAQKWKQVISLTNVKSALKKTVQTSKE